MRSLISLAGTALLAIGLVACGGGGNGGGGAPPSGGPTTPPLTLTVQVNGSTVAVDANGQYAVKAGDTVTITPSQSADWTSSNVDGSQVSLLVDSISSGKWSARLVNEKSTQGSYSVTAKAGTLTKTTLLKVGGGDARNGSYRVFAANGTQLSLKLNFDTRRYAMTDAAGQTSSDSFSADATEAGTWIFKSDKVTAAFRVSRFRVSQDTVVGAFPLVGLGATARVEPFIASRALVTAQGELDGTYNRLGTDIVSPSSTVPHVRQVQIAGGGTTLQVCNASTVTINACPPGSLATYAVSPTPRADSWLLTNTANPNDTDEFSIARMGGQNVYLAAGTSALARTMRVGLPETGAWPNVTARGPDLHQDWGTITLTALDVVEQYAVSGSPPLSFSNDLSTFPPQGPLGLRRSSLQGMSTGVVMQGAGLAMVLGDFGHMHLGLLD